MSSRELLPADAFGLPLNRRLHHSKCFRLRSSHSHVSRNIAQANNDQWFQRRSGARGELSEMRLPGGTSSGNVSAFESV